MLAGRLRVFLNLKMFASLLICQGNLICFEFLGTHNNCAKNDPHEKKVKDFK